MALLSVLPATASPVSRRILAATSLTVLLAFAPATLWAGPADLDTGFATNGIDTSFSGWNYINAFAPQSDGRWLLGGKRNGAGNDQQCPSDWVLFRLAADGGADPTLGGTGTLDVPVGGMCGTHETESGLDRLVVQSDGKLLGVGHGLDASLNPSVRLNRWNPDGTFDTTYHGTGKVALSLGAPAYSSAIALQKDGKSLVAGTLQGASSSQVYVLRYTTMGAKDPHFATNGMFTVPGGGATLAVQADGKILIGIEAINSGSSNVPEIVRLTTMGQLDTTFGGSGIVGLPIGTNVPAVLAQQPDGKIVGTVEPFGGTASYVFRLLPDGSLDTSFNGQGWRALGISSPRCMALTPTGQVLVAGVLWDFIENHDWLMLARLTPTGDLDTSFTSANGDSGSVRTGQALWCSQMQLQPDGRFAIAGMENAPDWKQPTYAARFLGDALDLLPDAVSFTPATGVPLSTMLMSNTVTISGLTPGAKVPIRVSGGSYRINMSPYSMALGYVGNGDKIRLKHTSAATSGTQVTTTVQVGGLSSPESPWVVRGGTISVSFTSTTQ
jgi:uncharacterized delta-60 repeat protein